MNTRRPAPARAIALPVRPAPWQSLRWRRLLALLLALALLLTSLLATRVARAQGDDDLREMSAVLSPLSHRTVDLAKRTLELDADQLAVAKSLYSGYRTAFRQSMKDAQAKMQAAMQKAMESGNPDDVGNPISHMMETITSVETLETAFHDDLKAVLTDKQLERYESFQRARRREPARLFQLMGGEAADVLDILHSLKIDVKGNAEAEAALSEYEASFDRSITERQAVLRELFQMMSKAKGMEEMEKVQEFLPRMYDKAKVLRDLNRQTARRVGEALPAEDRARFTQEVNRRSFPAIFRETGTGKKLDAALKLEGLDELKMGQIKALHATYTSQVELANTDWSQKFARLQEEIAGNFEKMMQMEETPSAKDVEAAREKRVELEKSMRERLEEVVGKDKLDQLPGTRPDDEVREPELMQPEFDKEAIDQVWGEDE